MENWSATYTKKYLKTRAEKALEKAKNLEIKKNKEMSKSTILIEISGGNVQRITSTEDINIITIDYDNLECGDVFDGKVLSPDAIYDIDSLNQYIKEETKKYIK